jgi:hypothetical protein
MLGHRYDNRAVAVVSSLASCVFLIPYSAVQLAGVMSTTIAQLYTVNHLNVAAYVAPPCPAPPCPAPPCLDPHGLDPYGHALRATYADEVYALRFAGIALGVAVLGPCGSLFGAATTLRAAMVLTAVAFALMAVTSYHPFRYCVALASAMASLAMVQVNALVQTLGRHDQAYQALINAEYRLLSTASTVIFPAFTTSVVLVLVPGGYWVAFLCASGILLLATLALDSRFEALAPPQEAHRGRGGRFEVLGLLQPYRAVLSVAKARAALANIMLVALPGQVVGAFTTSRFKELGASAQFQGLCLSLAAVAALPFVYQARRLLSVMSPQGMFALLGGLNGIAMVLMGLTGNPHALAVAHGCTFLVSKASPVAHSVWISQTVEPSLLPATFAVEKIVNGSLRSLVSHGLGLLALRFPLADLFVGFGLLSIAIYFQQSWAERRERNAPIDSSPKAPKVQ